MNKVWSPRPGLTHNGLVPGEKKVWLTLQTPVINTQIKALIVQRDVCVKMCKKKVLTERKLIKTVQHLLQRTALFVHEKKKEINSLFSLLIPTS